VNRRCEPRIEVSRPVQITVFQAPENRFSGYILNLSGKGMRLLSSVPIAVGALVSVKWDRTLVLGEVCYCYGLPDGKEFGVGVQLEHALRDTVEMARLAKKLLALDCGPIPRESGDPAKNGRQQNCDEDHKQCQRQPVRGAPAPKMLLDSEIRHTPSPAHTDAT
jgi:hypothetical protein